MLHVDEAHEAASVHNRSYDTSTDGKQYNN